MAKSSSLLTFFFVHDERLLSYTSAHQKIRTGFDAPSTRLKSIFSDDSFLTLKKVVDRRVAHPALGKSKYGCNFQGYPPLTLPHSVHQKAHSTDGLNPPN